MRLSRIVCIVFVFCAGTTTASPAQTFTTLASFDRWPNGTGPNEALIQGTDGNFYGTTFFDSGTVFKVTPAGTLTTLHNFCAQTNCADGYHPNAGLVQATDGNFYGTTRDGAVSGCGNRGCGTVFKLTPAGALTTLYSFCSKSGCTDGSDPSGELVRATDGNFYGTTATGGASGACSGGCGTVFKLTPAGALTTLYSFCSKSGCTDGSAPLAGLVQGTDGNFYGTTAYGGATFPKVGTVFKLTPAGALTTLYSFCSSGCTDGAVPLAGLVQGTDGNFYGTNRYGANGHGTVFKITPAGTLTTLYGFCAQTSCADGSEPLAGLVQGTDGNFYGTTNSGGSKTGGTVFKVTPAGTLTTLYSFCAQTNCADGSFPSDGRGLVQGTDGKFYGTTGGGGASNNCSVGCGTVFSLSVDLQSNPLQFVPVTPCRVADTRKVGAFGAPSIAGGTSRDFLIPQSSCGIPSTAAAYSLNFTVVPRGRLGYLTVWPTGLSKPLASTLNSLDGRIKANAAIVPAGSSGAIRAFVTDTTDLIIDINGYFVTDPSQLAFYPLPPCRVFDTRDATGPLGGPSMVANQQRDFSVQSSACGVPSTALAYSLNFTVVPHDILGYLTVWPSGQSQPVVSTLNALTGVITANAAIVPAGTGGDISTFVTDNTDLVADINGYFAPPGSGGQSLYAAVPCRVLDTRTSVGAFQGELTVNVEGSPCGLPSTAQAYVFNATVVPQGALGYLTLWPDGTSQPVVSTLNALDGAITSNMAIVPTLNGFIDAFTTNKTDLILDVFSYFAP